MAEPAMGPDTGGRFDFDDGGTYCGGWKEGKAHGHGICTGPKGEGEYSGAWHYGFEVSGVYTWPSGNTYQGQWQNGKRHGLGIELRGRWVYRGEWTQGYKGRYGERHSTSSQSKYEGTWANGLQDGYGVETYADAGSYQGQWLRGARHGYGIRKSAVYSEAAKYRSRSHACASLTSLRSDQGNTETDKEKNEDDSANKGGFVLRARSEPPSNKRSLSEKSMAVRRTILHGFRIKKQRSTGDIDSKIAAACAVSVKSSGSTGSCGSEESGPTGHRSGHGILAALDTCDEFVDPNSVETYSGEWKNDKRSGYGICERTDGLRYEGEWFNNKKYGYGSTTFKDGTREQGKYKNNVLVASNRCRSALFVRASKLHERVENAVQSASRASMIAAQKTEIAVSRASTAVDRANQADVAAQQAVEDCEIARICASAYAPDFSQPGLINKQRSLDLMGNHVDSQGTSSMPFHSAVTSRLPKQYSAPQNSALFANEPFPGSLTYHSIPTDRAQTSPLAFQPNKQMPHSNASTSFEEVESNVTPSSARGARPTTSVSLQNSAAKPTPPIETLEVAGSDRDALDRVADGLTRASQHRQSQWSPAGQPHDASFLNRPPTASFPPPPPLFDSLPGVSLPSARPLASPSSVSPTGLSPAALAAWSKTLNNELLYAVQLASQKLYLQHVAHAMKYNQGGPGYDAATTATQLGVGLNAPPPPLPHATPRSRRDFAAEASTSADVGNSAFAIANERDKGYLSEGAARRTALTVLEDASKNEPNARLMAHPYSMRDRRSPRSSSSQLSLVNDELDDRFDQYGAQRSSRTRSARTVKYDINSPHLEDDDTGQSIDDAVFGVTRRRSGRRTTLATYNELMRDAGGQGLPSTSAIEQASTTIFRPGKTTELHKFSIGHYLRNTSDTCSLPDLMRDEGTGTTKGLSREEVSRLSSQRRQELQRMHEEAELLSSNPLRIFRYLYHPAVRAWLLRWKLPLLVFLTNFCLTLTFYKLITQPRYFNGSQSRHPPDDHNSSSGL